MLKSFKFFLVYCLLIVMVGCSISPQVMSKFRERVLPSVLGSPAALDKLGIRNFDEGAIVVFTGADPQQAGHDLWGYAIFRRDFGIWRAGQIGTTNVTAGDPTGKLIAYFVSDFNFQGEAPPLTFEYRLLAGEILSATAVSIEAVLDDGTILPDAGDDDVFAFVIEAAHTVCELRVLDTEGRVLESFAPVYEVDFLPVPEC